MLSTAGTRVTGFVPRGILAAALALSAGLGCRSRGMPSTEGMSGLADGPADQGVKVARIDGDADRGRDVFRFETFGDEGFWTDAVRLPAGMVAAKVTPLQALDLGVQIDIDAVPTAVREQLVAQLKADPTGRSSALLNDPMVTIALINANAVIGMPIKDSNGDGVMNAMKGDKVGASCALCHTMADGAVLTVPNGGAIGHRHDGLANHSLNMGKIFATAANTRALYPMAELSLRANNGKVLGRAPTGLTENSTEAEFDAYFGNPEYYPVGMFDDTYDGNGDPMHNSPLFRQDLAAPFGSDGTIARLDNFSNLVYTSLFDMTTLTTPGGRKWLHTLAGPAGDELADNYVKVLAATNVTGYPYVKATAGGTPATEDTPVGLRVDEGLLRAMNAYLVKLDAPRGARVEAAVAARGRAVFRASGCVSCHNVDQRRPVPANIVAMKSVWPGDNPDTLAQRMPPLNPIVNSPGIFDDKMAVVNASIRGDKRGLALPLLLDLARKPVFLHDNSVASLDLLFDPSRGPAAPHAVYVADQGQRSALVSYLKSLDTAH